MRMKKWLTTGAIALAMGAGFASLNGCADQSSTTPSIQEDGYSTPFPVQQGGEQIDVLVRVKDSKRRHHLNFVFVERRDWPEKKMDEVARIFDGFVVGDVGSLPYPIKLRVRIDSVGDDTPVHIDQVVTERNPFYSRYVDDDAVIWRAQQILARALPPGIYRVRVDNLVPVPQIDFPTRFLFERDNRRY